MRAIWIGSALWSIAAHALFFAALLGPAPEQRLRIEMELAEVPKPPSKVEPPAAPPPLPPPPPPVERVIAKRVIRKPVLRGEPPPPPPKIGVDESELAPEGGMAVAAGVTLDGVIGTGTGTVAKAGAADGVPGGRGRGRVRQVPIFAVTRLPKAKVVIEPEVPETWRSRSRDIVVVVELDIDARGRVEEVRVIRGAGVDLDRAVVRAAEETEFEPALVGPDPVPVRYRIPYRIRVRG